MPVTPSKTRGVLILDSDDVLCRVLMVALPHWGFRARRADAASALAVLRGQGVADLVVIDANLHCDEDLLSELRCRFRGVVGVVLTDWGPASVCRLTSADVAADAVLRKPYSIADLIARLRLAAQAEGSPPADAADS